MIVIIPIGNLISFQEKLSKITNFSFLNNWAFSKENKTILELLIQYQTWKAQFLLINNPIIQRVNE